jgi:transcriptional regulator GlxA family with amidase domain
VTLDATKLLTGVESGLGSGAWALGAGAAGAHAFELQLRVDRAKTLLAGGLDIAAVDLRTGFADQSHITRIFRRSVGVTRGRFPRYPGPLARASGE